MRSGMSRRAFALSLTLLPLAAAAQQGLQTFERSTLEIVAQSGRHKFDIELALTSDQQAQGLMFRQRLAPDAGMLFLYTSEQPIAMWMANTFIPLDMIFIGADGRIRTIAARTVPHSTAIVSSGGAALAVLEVNGGTASRLGIAVGDRVLHPAFAAR